MRRTTRKLAVLIFSGLLLGGVSQIAHSGDAPARLNDVSVERADDGATVRVKTSGPVRYEASLIDSPARLVIDLGDTIYAWPRTRLSSDAAPIKEVRGSQFKPGVARIVVEMTRRTAYRIDQGPDGLVVTLDPVASAKTDPGSVASPSEPSLKAPAVSKRPVAPTPGGPAPRATDPPAVVAQSPATTRLESRGAVPQSETALAMKAAPAPKIEAPTVKADTPVASGQAQTPALQTVATPAKVEATVETPAVVAGSPAASEPKPLAPAAKVDPKVETPAVVAGSPAASEPKPLAPATKVDTKVETPVLASPAPSTPKPLAQTAKVEATAETPVVAAQSSASPAPSLAAAGPKGERKVDAATSKADALASKAAPTSKANTLASKTGTAEPKADASAAPPTPAASPRAMAALPSPIVIAQAQTGRPATAQAPVANGGKLISLDFKDADIQNLLRILAAESGRNIVAGEDVRGKVSVSLRNVTWEQALDTILEVKGLSKVEKGGVIRIVSLEQLTKEREAQARVEEAKRRAEIETRTKLAEAELKEAELAARRAINEAAAEEARRRGPLQEETIRLSYADPEEVARTLQGILGIPPEGTQPVSTVIPTSPPSVPTGAPPIMEPPFAQLYGQGAQRPAPLVSVSQDVLAKGITIRAHKPTNTIFIRHYASDLERIKKLVREQLDVPLPQVKIEARMEILDRNALEAIGIQWGGGMAGQSGGTTVVGQGYQSALGRVPGQTLPVQGGVLQPDGSTVLVNPAGPTAPKTNIPLNSLFQVDQGSGLPIGGNLVNLPFQLLPNAGTQIPAAGIAFGIIGSNFNINLALQALASQGKTRTLARPEIVTVENNKASVSLGEEIPYATVSSAGTQIQFKEALLKLDVTPTVIRERLNNEEVRKIKMVVVVENNSRGDLVNLGSGGTPPAINRRKAETQVLIREGERLVIGGVTQSVTATNVRKVPVLGDMPIFGWLFKQKETFETGRELVVFVTPVLLRTDGAVASR